MNDSIRQNWRYKKDKSNIELDLLMTKIDEMHDTPNPVQNRTKTY